tara:strand:- start:116 stop:793 length:678 start_codon:yes stop_codon:yes gene_type:complete
MDYLNYEKEKLKDLPTTGVGVYIEPFPHLIVENFYDEKEVELIWEELKFYTKPNKLLTPKDYKGVVGSTNAHALELDVIYSKQLQNDVVNYRNVSNILTVNRKLFTSGILKKYSEIHDCCTTSLRCTHDFTKVRYYHDGEYYKPHVDVLFHTLAFSYFHKEPKLFSGGELYFPKYNYEYPCNNNTMIIFPSWVEHGVREVKIKNSDYFDGFGRYAITSFLTTREQ